MHRTLVIKQERKKGAGATREYNLAITHPHYATMWHPTFNENAAGNPLTPEMVTAGSKKKAWWVCDRAHVFDRIIKDLVLRKGKCPFCSGRRLSSDNSLAACYPGVAATWHPVRNGSLSPDEVRPGSRARHWWVCERGHEWPASPYSRTSLKTGCPECAGRKVGKDNNLARLHPEIAATLHPTKNQGIQADRIHARSHDKFVWFCQRGHEWSATVYNRTVNRSGCPKCNPMTSRLEIRIFCELKSVFNGDVSWRSKIGKREVDILLSGLGVGIEVDGNYHHKHKMQKDEDKTRDLEKRGIKIYRVRMGLLPLSNRDIETDEHDSGDTILTIKKLLDQLRTSIRMLPIYEEAIDDYMKQNIFINEQEFQIIVASLPGPPPGKSLADLYPEVAASWHDVKNGKLRPNMFTPGVRFAPWWQCEKGHEWRASIFNRVGGRGCPECANRRVGRDNNLMSRFPEAAATWHPTKNKDKEGNVLSPDMVASKSNVKRWWICHRQHEWEAPVSSRTQQGAGCPHCYRDRISKKRTSCGRQGGASPPLERSISKRNRHS